MHAVMPWEYPRSMEPDERPWLADSARARGPVPMDPCLACVADEEDTVCIDHGRLIVELL